MKCVLIIISSIIFASNAQIKIAGEQDGVFDSATYLVSKDLIVPENKKLEFLPGSRMLFMPFCGIKVFGQLKLIDSKIGSSDSIGGAWNGIEVAQRGKIDFGNVVISRSIMGINVPDSTALHHFKNIKFISNKSSLRIAEIPVFIRDGEPFSFEPEKIGSPKTVIRTENLVVGASIRDVYKTKPSIIALRWGAALAALSCTALCAHFAEASEHYMTKYNNADNNTEAKSLINTSDSYKKVAIATGVGAGIFSITLLFSISFNFGSK